MEDQRQSERVGGRSLQVETWGACREDLELAALDTARRFFGEDAQIEIVPDYKVRHYASKEPKPFHAHITIREISR